MSSVPRFDGCEVVKKLHSGPATDWYLGRQVALDRKVVIKALSPNVLPDSAFAAPLMREARLLGSLQHRQLVQLYDFVQRQQSIWLVLEFVDGWTLAELLERDGRLPLDAALSITIKITEALSYVHSRGIVHRDIRPGNVLVAKSGDVKLTNFFLAAERDTPPPPELLEGNHGFASPSYMSPEQVLGEQADPRSDLFSLGVVLYELLSGGRPFDGSDLASTSQRIRHEAPPPFSHFNVEVPAHVERIVVRALQKLPADRFDDARELQLALEQARQRLKPSVKDGAVSFALARSGLINTPKTEREAGKGSKSKSSLLRAGVRIYSACFGLMILGAVLIAALADPRRGGAAPRDMTLKLRPERAAQLRAVAQPWAHVFVDGQQVGTTPFAESIPLGPGVHTVKFTHPAAPAQVRTIEALPEQSILLDVQMKLAKPLATEPDLLALPPGPPDGGVTSP